jgi:hypothetical protein
VVEFHFWCESVSEANLHAMIRRLALAADMKANIGNQTFRAGGITAYLRNGAFLEKAAVGTPFTLEKLPVVLAPSQSRQRSCSFFFEPDSYNSHRFCRSLRMLGVLAMQPPTVSLVTQAPGLKELIEKGRSYIRVAEACTLPAYQTDFADFTRFCEEHIHLQLIDDSFHLVM